MSFLYSILLKLLYPTSVSFLLVLAALVFLKCKREKLARAFLLCGLAVLLICGNGWITGALARHLEWQNLPLDPVPQADCILVLSGGILGKVTPRPTVEVGDAG